MNHTNFYKYKKFNKIMETTLDGDVEKDASNDNEAERIFHRHKDAGYAALCPEGQRTRVLYFGKDMEGYVEAIESITHGKKMGRIVYNPIRIKELKGAA